MVHVIPTCGGIFIRREQEAPYDNDCTGVFRVPVKGPNR